MKRSDKGQVTIFIIIGIIIVVAGVLVYLYYPKIQSTIGVVEETPATFIQSCMEDKIEESVDTLSLHGGSIEPDFSYLYDGVELEYLCYTSNYYVMCAVQQPLLKTHIEFEIKKDIAQKAEECFDDLEETYSGKGYSVNLQRGATGVELLPKRVVVTFNNSLTLTKNEVEKYEPFEVVLSNNLYELISIANSIVNWETNYGDAEVTIYMSYYHDLKVEKLKQSDGTTLYIITDRNNENKFQFASRSLAWPPGYL